MFKGRTLLCGRCRGRMHPVRLRVGRLRILLGGLLMACGFIMLAESPASPALAVPGTLMLALAWWVGIRREDIWCCDTCSHSVPRRGIPIDLEQRRGGEPAA